MALQILIQFKIILKITTKISLIIFMNLKNRIVLNKKKILINNCQLMIVEAKIISKEEKVLNL